MELQFDCICDAALIVRALLSVLISAISCRQLLLEKCPWQFSGQMPMHWQLASHYLMPG